jgi:hypothetical protein
VITVSNVHCFTSASLSYLDRARILASTVKKFHPEWVLWLCLPDEEPPGFTFHIENEQFDGLVRIRELAIPSVRSWCFKHNLIELCTAVKGPMLCHLLDKGAEKVIYLDPDIALFDTLEPVLDLLDGYSIILTPHQVKPEIDDNAVIDNEIGSLKHGIYNLGFLAIRSSEQSCAFARWWRDRLLSHCYDDIASGLFTDQRWCDLIPAFFDDTFILRDIGYNVASWNLSHRPITINEDGSIDAGGQALRFFHFTKVTSIGETMLERYANGYEVFELLSWYKRRLRSFLVADLPAGWWAFAKFDDGAPITPQHRRIYRSRNDLQQAFPNPFLSGPQTYQAWLTANPCG